MWSCGLILFELLTGNPLFPGENEKEQLCLIMEILGKPPENILKESTRKNLFFDDKTGEPTLVKDSNGLVIEPGKKNLREVMKKVDETFFDFIEKCLVWDPEKRLTPTEALGHKWILEGLPKQL